MQNQNKMSTIIQNNKSENNFKNHGVVNEQLHFLAELDDYKVHHNDVDVRGYTAKLTTGEVIGEVEGLLADKGAELVRYIEIDVNDDVRNSYRGNRYTSNDRYALIPIGIAQIDSSNKTVMLNGIQRDHFVDYPRFDRSTGYTTSYELDTAEYLSGFHKFGKGYDNSLFNTDRNRGMNRLDGTFYMSGFYTGR